MFDEDLLKPFVLLDGLTASELWPTINFILPTWFLLAFLPHWKYTPKLTLIGPIIHAVIYTLGVISLLMDPTHNEGKAPDMSTFEGVVNMFQDPNGVFVGWIHYVVYDALIGRWIVLDSMERGCSVLIHVLVIIPCLVMALLFGPMGWLLYVALIRTVILRDTSPGDVLHLNIGGTKTTILRRTLTSVPGSMLALTFSGRWDDSLEKDDDGNFFIDQEFSLFQPMLKYLRNKANGIEKYPLNSPQKVGQEEGNSMQDFYRMLDYYGMSNGIYPTNLTIHTGLEDSVEYIHRMKVNAREWTTFQLSENGHGRKVQSYEVTLGDDVKRIQIGWIHSTHLVNLNTADRNIAGVGDVSYTYALDLTNSTFLLNGKSNPIDRLEYKKGTIVRSENYGSDWYVDGETIFPSSKEKCKDLKGLCPLISIKGEMEITFIQLVD